MKKYDGIIIGGGVAGLSLGMALVKRHPDKSFLIIREEEKNLVPCGIPYIFGKLNNDVDKGIKPHAPFIKEGGDFLVGKVSDINRTEKRISTDAGETFYYEKLILATGSTPLIPTFIKGYETNRATYIKKSYKYISELIPKLKDAKRVAIIGGGFIGLEVADELANNKEKKVTVIEMQSHCLSAAFSDKFCINAEKSLEEKGIKIIDGAKLLEVQEEENELKLILSENRDLAVDIVIFALGYRPNTTLAKKANLQLNNFGAIKTNSFLQTDDSNIYAIGDCAQKRDFITGKETNAMLASVAGAESRILAENLFKVQLFRNCLGTIRIFSTSLNDTVFASVGKTENEAISENINVVFGEFSGVDHHPGTLPGTSKVMVKLTVSKEHQQIIGAEIKGGQSVGEMINVIGTAIQAKLSIHTFYTYQMGTQPLLTGGPTVYPLTKAVENAILNLSKAK